MKIMSVVGARPQFVKCAILRKLFDASSVFQEQLIHTGQHYDFEMSEVFFQELSIRAPDHFLSVSGGSHGAMTGQMLARIEEVLLAEAADAVLVYGDTNSTLAGALAAAKLHLPVVHVEAGLRSFNRKMPEEVNRVLTDHVSSVLFCSTSVSVENLAKENITRGVHHVGDIMYDAVKAIAHTADPATLRKRYGLGDARVAVCTVHRAENTANAARLDQIFRFVEAHVGDHIIVLPLHPGTRAKAESLGVRLPDVRIIEPVSYIELQGLLSVSDLVLTDSGGLQKEAYFHGVPCITLRDETEWVETVDSGWNALWTDPYHRPRRPIDEYGDGFSGQRMIEILERDLPALVEA